MTSGRNPHETLAVTNSDAAKMLGISERHLATLNSDGRMGARPVRLGNAVRWPVDELKGWLAAGAPNREHWEAIRENPSGGV